jgi:nitrogen fixation protein FixH
MEEAMKKIILLVVAAMMLVAGVAFAGDYTVAKKAGGFDVVVTIDKNPVVVGNNNVTVSVKDASGKAVTDAKVVVDYSMPAMPGMPAMNYKANAQPASSDYRAAMNISMSGAWNVAVKITKDGKTSSVKFNVDAQ